MARLCADFLFEVRELWVHRDLLGAVFTIELEGFDCELSLPRDGTSFDHRLGEEDRGLAFGSSSKGTPKDPQIQLTVRLVRVRLCSNADVSAADFNPPQPDASDRGFAFLERADSVAKRLVGELLDWARVRGQPQLGLHGEAPKMAGAQLLLDADRNESLPLSWPGIRSYMYAIGSDVPFDPPSFEETLRRIAQREPLPTAETLLADALHLIREPSPDPDRAVLTAAIAAEVKIKQVLRDSAAPATRPMVEVLLNNPRDFSVAAAGLFDQALKAVAGHSLRDSDRELWKRITKLYERRNAIAHRGERLNRQEAGDSVAAAKAAFDWLDKIAPADGRDLSSKRR